jgi:SAM-dependent methyltransferase
MLYNIVRGCNMPLNWHRRTIEGFGREWSRFDQACAHGENFAVFQQYFSIFPWSSLPSNAVGFDLGCGSGRWARYVAPRVGRLHCIDPSCDALEVCRRNLQKHDNCEFWLGTIETVPLADESMDFGYALGVLHHIPDTAAALSACARKLKPGALLLVYIYYALENRPWWYRALWLSTILPRMLISRLPFWLRCRVTDVIAALVYWPFARGSLVLAKAGLDPDRLPLSAHRNRSFYSMRTNALDRFGTHLEQRFTREEIEAMMKNAELEDIRFRELAPFWCAVGSKAKS